MIRKVLCGTLIVPFFLLLTSVSFGQNFKDVIPKQDISLYRDGELVEPKEPIQTGELVELVIAKIKDSDKPKELVDTVYNWKVFEIKYDKDGKEYKIFRKSYRPLTDNPFGPSVLFPTGNRTAKFYVEVSAVYVFCKKTNDKINISTYVNRIESSVKIIGDSPSPEPGPTPPDPDTPTFPDGRFKLSKTVYDSVIKNVTENNRQKGAVASANAYKSVSAAISAGTIKTITDALQEARKLNDNNLNSSGVTPGSWNTFGLSLQTVLYDLYDKNQITTVSDLRDAFLEISSGLEKVK